MLHHTACRQRHAHGWPSNASIRFASGCLANVGCERVRGDIARHRVELVDVGKHAVLELGKAGLADICEVTLKFPVVSTAVMEAAQNHAECSPVLQPRRHSALLRELTMILALKRAEARNSSSGDKRAGRE